MEEKNQGLPSAESAAPPYFVLMSGEDMSAEYAGDRTGTVADIFTNENAAYDALADIERASSAQYAAHRAWTDRSYDENPIYAPPLGVAAEKDYAKIGAAMIDRTHRRDAWIKQNPPPPSNLMHRFWVVRIEDASTASPAEPAPKAVEALPNSAAQGEEK